MYCDAVQDVLRQHNAAKGVTTGNADLCTPAAPAVLQAPVGESLTPLFGFGQGSITTAGASETLMPLFGFGQVAISTARASKSLMPLCGFGQGSISTARVSVFPRPFLGLGKGQSTPDKTLAISYPGLFGQRSRLAPSILWQVQIRQSPYQSVIV